MKRFILYFAGVALLCGQAVSLPKAARTVLPNGVTLLLVPRSDVPLLTLQATVRGGDEAVPADKAGLADLTAALLSRGTGKRSADQFATELDSLGATFRADSTAQYMAASLEGLSKDAPVLVDLFADAVLRPAFAQAEFDKQLGRQKDGLRAMKDNPGAAIGMYAQANFFGAGHPYGAVASEATLSAITRDDLAAFHKQNFSGKNLIVLAVGQMEQSSLEAALKKAFADVPAGTAFAGRPVPAPGRPAENTLLLVNKPDTTQTYFQIGMPGIARTSPDRVPLILANTIFGGRFTSLLNDELRVNTGLTYGASSQLQQNRLPGSLQISTFTRTETTVRAMDIALDILRKFGQNGLTAEQLASAKAYVKGLYPTQNLETSEQIATQLSLIEVLGLSRGDFDDYFAKIDAVTLEQVNAVVKKYYGEGPLRFVLVGSGPKIRDQVKKYAPRMVEMEITAPGWRPAR